MAVHIDFDPNDLRPIIEAVVQETLDRIEHNNGKLNGQLAYPEAQAAELLGIPRHSLRDARRRGEIESTRVGKRILYTAAAIQELLEKNRIS